MALVRNLQPLFALPSERKIISYVQVYYLPEEEDGEIESDEGEKHDEEEFDDIDESDTDDDGSPLGQTWIDAAVEYLTNNYVHEASSYPWHKGTWYLGGDESWDSRGQMERITFHLEGFTPEEEKEIYETLKAGRQI